MRSLIYVDVAKEQYRVKLNHWLYAVHVPESISKFRPYVSQYAFYNALPVPPLGEQFGTVRMQLTEHYWQVNPMDVSMAVNVFTETFPTEVLIWQGNMPENAIALNYEGDEARSAKVENCNPFVFAFLPISWEEDLKGAGRTMADGPNYRWNFALHYPDGVSVETGDQWFYEKFVPAFLEIPEATRMVTSKIIKEINDCPMDRVVEIWFEGPDQWSAAMEKAKSIEPPEWAQEETFPYLKPYQNIMGVFVADNISSDNLNNHRGYITMR
ncbi:Uncharacterised protein [uncultured Roseburia sp.]|uniref:Acetyl-CoA hydrolase n=1 Tax=Brotonthovivens ammoniilytica TaxID=2981725 RepID=A0ABT2TM05_9FIRM|nr:acetyl-CoA hydrolase [Brotonthovivens ammoniilytica]MCU6763245.1 acetyl-CoA hydrolase [Brotonthovivens ammoniilytica]SCJ10618.1 Uncharacterised protein [uncultured Roseburia sp.]